jgi:hypothetical protein
MRNPLFKKRRMKIEAPHTTHTLIWQGIEIEATYCPLRWKTIAHLEIRSANPPRSALPISETGYLSWFHQPNTIEASGLTVEAFVRTQLDEAASASEWRRHLEQNRQLSLL